MRGDIGAGGGEIAGRRLDPRAGVGVGAGAVRGGDERAVAGALAGAGFCGGRCFGLCHSGGGGGGGACAAERAGACAGSWAFGVEPACEAGGEADEMGGAA